MEQKNTWETYDTKQLEEVEAFAREYMDFLDNGKTERECIDQIVNTLEDAGYQELEALVKEGKKIKAGDKVALSGTSPFLYFIICHTPIQEKKP